MSTAKIKQTSSDSAIVEPIVLRPGKTTRLVFKAQIVNNAHDENKPVRGELLWQRRGQSEQEDEWVDESQLRLSKMTAGSGVKLDLNTDEFYLLTQAVRGLYGVYWKNGKRLPHTGDEFDLADYAQVAKSLDTIDDVASIIAETGAQGFSTLLKLLAKKGNAANLLQASAQMDLADLTSLSAVAGIGILRQALALWKDNEANGDEGFWQDSIAERAFVLSQLFSSPVVMFQDKAFVGGKDIAGVGGKSPDFVLSNEITSHLLIVEIKTPATPLLGDRPYRSPNIYAPHRELAGSAIQIATYKDVLLKNYPTLRLNSTDKFLCAEPRCLVIVGHTDQLDDDAKRDSFEHFRRGQRSTEIITFDELFRKIELLLALLEGHESGTSESPDTPATTW